MNIILIILVFGVIVFFHELGHFIVAKINKISVTEFSIGMGPAIFAVRKNETRYCIRLFPIGGYCLMLGEDGNEDENEWEEYLKSKPENYTEAEKESDEEYDKASGEDSAEALNRKYMENSFENKPVWVRMLVIAAGPVFNFILAFIFSIVLIHFTGCDPSTLRYVAEDGAAAEAGIEAGDTIKEINGKRIYNYRELLLFLQLNDPSKPIELLMEDKDGAEYAAEVTPKLNEDGQYMLGVSGGYVKSEGIGMDIKYAGLELRYWVKATVTSLRMIVTGGVKSGDILGPVGVGGAMNDVIEEVKEESGSKKEAVINILLNLLNWCILLSVNLGIMNLLPIPALDGGRLLFLLIEAVRRKKIPKEKEAIVNTVGFIILIGLMVIVFFNDIKNVFF